MFESNFPDPRLFAPRDDGDAYYGESVDDAEKRAKPYTVRELYDRLGVLMAAYDFAGDLDVFCIGPESGGPAVAAAVDGLSFGPTYLYLGWREAWESEEP